MGLAWLITAGVIAMLALMLIIAMYGLSAIFQVTVWLLTQIGVLFIRLIGWIVSGVRRLIDRIRDAQL